MLYMMAIGDAYGAGFEFAPDSFVAEHNNLKGYLPHPKDGTVLPAGSYTDDTQMSIAIAELILAGGPFTCESFADAFVSTFKRDPRQGYAERFFALLSECETGSDLRRLISPTSTRNGAMMRSVPLGLLPDAAAVVRIAALQASVTHDTFAAKLSSQTIGLMAHSLIHGAKISDLPAIVRRDLGFDLLPWSGRVACDAEQTVRAVWTALYNSTTLSEVLQSAVAFGGDTDSVAAVALGLASLSPEYYNNIPAVLLHNLEEGWPVGHKYGSAFLRELDGKISFIGGIP